MIQKVDSIIKRCNHDFIQIHPNDPIRTRCKKCGKAFETNPYTGEMTEISEKEVKRYQKHFDELEKS